MISILASVISVSKKNFTDNNKGFEENLQNPYYISLSFYKYITIRHDAFRISSVNSSSGIALE